MILQITAGAGPVEARRFVALLATHVDPRWTGDRAPSSVRLEVGPEVAEAWVGTHALLAATRGKGRRKRWFVEVRAFEDAGGALPAREIHLSAARSGGPGGQNVNKRASAVRAVDRVSGEAVRASDQRSYARNRALALERLTARLEERQAEREARVETERWLAHHRVKRGEARYVWRLGTWGLERVA